MKFLNFIKLKKKFIIKFFYFRIFLFFKKIFIYNIDFIIKIHILIYFIFFNLLFLYLFLFLSCYYNSLFRNLFFFL
jgi:hypothetical protein